MGFFDDLLGKKKETNTSWEIKYRGMIKDVSYDMIVSTIGKSQKSKDDYVYWRGPVTDLDPNYSDEDFFQLSNKGYRFKGKPNIDTETWYVYATSERAIRQVADEVGGNARSIEEV